MTTGPGPDRVALVRYVSPSSAPETPRGTSLYGSVPRGKSKVRRPWSARSRTAPAITALPSRNNAHFGSRPMWQ